MSGSSSIGSGFQQLDHGFRIVLIPLCVALD